MFVEEKAFPPMEIRAKGEDDEDENEILLDQKENTNTGATIINSFFFSFSLSFEPCELVRIRSDRGVCPSRSSRQWCGDCS